MDHNLCILGEHHLLIAFNIGEGRVLHIVCVLLYKHVHILYNLYIMGFYACLCRR